MLAAVVQITTFTQSYEISRDNQIFFRKMNVSPIRISGWKDADKSSVRPRMKTCGFPSTHTKSKTQNGDTPELSARFYSRLSGGFL